MAVIAAQVRGSGITCDEPPVDVESILGLENAMCRQARQILAIHGETRDSEISVTMPVDLCTLPAEMIHPLPQLLKARCGLPGLKAIAMTSSTGIPIVDLRTAIDTLPAR